MWEVNNTTPFEAERSWVRDKNGAEVWIVAVKGTFDILPDGNLRVAENQEKINLAPQLREGDSQFPSLLFDTDLPYKKLNTDVIVDGCAYAPNGQPADKVNVGLKVANIYKILTVFGDRYWKRNGVGIQISKPAPFTKMPVIYERAFGGFDDRSDDSSEHDWEPRNPSGCGYAVKKEHLIDRPLPNIEEPKSLIARWNDRPEPVGFSPLAGHWMPRVKLAGTYDKKWEEERQPLLAEDFDDHFFQCAPADQQANGFLKGGEDIELANMSPEGRLKFRVPRISFAITTDFDDATSVVHRPVIHTVTIRPDLPQVLVVWHVHHECHNKVLKLNRTTIRVKERIMQPDRASSRDSEIG